jgi:hypothetical protein
MAANQQSGTSVPVAQDDVLGEATRVSGPVDGTDTPPGAGGAPRDRGQGSREAEETGEARPGKDENQAGFLKDQDKRHSP